MVTVLKQGNVSLAAESGTDRVAGKLNVNKTGGYIPETLGETGETIIDSVRPEIRYFWTEQLAVRC